MQHPIRNLHKVIHLIGIFSNQSKLASEARSQSFAEVGGAARRSRETFFWSARSKNGAQLEIRERGAEAKTKTEKTERAHRQSPHTGEGIRHRTERLSALTCRKNRLLWEGEKRCKQSKLKRANERPCIFSLFISITHQNKDVYASEHRQDIYF